MKAGSSIAVSKLEHFSQPHLDKTDKVLNDIIQKHDTALRRFLSRRLESREVVDEIIQEVYIKIARTCNHEELKYPKAFIFKVASNLVIDHLRANRVRKSKMHLSLLDRELACTKPSPEQALQSRQAFELIEGVLERLKPDRRRIFVLHRFKGLTYDQIASKIGISRDKVKHNISAVLVLCREELSDLL